MLFDYIEDRLPFEDTVTAVCLGNQQYFYQVGQIRYAVSPQGTDLGDCMNILAATSEGEICEATLAKDTDTDELIVKVRRKHACTVLLL